MKISKHVHSCLLVEENNNIIIIDPGEYSSLDVDALEKLDFILITHEHADHMHVPLIKKAVDKFPDVKIISNSSVAEILGKEGIKVLTEGNEFIEIEAMPHEKVLGKTPENVLFRVFEKLTHPGDSHSFDSTTEVLAMPVQAPWGSFVNSMEKAVKLKPKIVIPIHDWHWTEEARKGLYERATSYLKEQGIEFKAIETGEVVEV
ncbi:hypothetical protein CMO88_01520 [Candidatus Woesearchaeota archaeon]|mgnify:CR=1 FL=1|nr:hypothetical protein [Candidatus Woesearchaeota archaeon]|tara:strand:- start:1545 stop:2156 length:612 start_codon:yes stop_codon:yes gene_type:complete